jgi:capsular polysaccharide biosynthesis protein
MLQTSEGSPFANLATVLRRRWPVVAVVALIAVAAAAGALATRSRSYQATAKLLVVPVSQDDQIYFGTGMLRDAGDPSLTAATTAQILHSENIAKQTAAQLTGMTADSVLQHVEVGPSAESNVLLVTGTAGSSTDAVRLADAYVRSITTVRWHVVSAGLRRRIAALEARPSTSQQQVEPLRAALRNGSDPTLVVTQPAAAAKASAQSPAAVILILALAGGLFLGALVALGLDALTGRVRGADDARRAFRLSLWGEIPTLPRKLRHGGAVAPSRLSPGAIRAFHAAAAHIAHWTSDGGVFALISPSDRDGRTTTAVNVATALAMQGRRAALLSLDTDLDRQIVADLHTAGVELLNDGSVPLRDALERARDVADVVVIDGPPAHRAINLVAEPLSAQLLLVVRVDHTRRQDLVAAREVLEEIGARPLGMVLLGSELPRRKRLDASTPRPAGPRAAEKPAAHVGESRPVAVDGGKQPWDPALRP